MITNPKARIEELDINMGDTVYYRFFIMMVNSLSKLRLHGRMFPIQILHFR